MDRRKNATLISGTGFETENPCTRVGQWARLIQGRFRDAPVKGTLRATGHRPHAPKAFRNWAEARIAGARGRRRSQVANAIA